MFGMGMSEILVILLVAALFLGPEKLPDAATKISKGIRDLRRQTKDLQDTIENDTELGGAIRDLKSALRGDELRRPPVRKPPPSVAAVAASVAALEAADGGGLPAGTGAPDPALATDPPAAEPAVVEAPAAAAGAVAVAGDETVDAAAGEAAAEVAPLSVPAKLTLAPTVGSSDREGADGDSDDTAELARLVRPASGAIKRDGHG